MTWPNNKVKDEGARARARNQRNLELSPEKIQEQLKNERIDKAIESFFKAICE